MEIRQLRTLIAIIEHDTFAAAGEAVGLTQSSVSLHIKALEDELGLELFDRSHRPPLLTPGGRELAERAREIVDLCNQIEQNVKKTELAGTLRLGAVPTALGSILPPALASLQQTHPRLHIRVTSGLSAELATKLSRGEVDVIAVTRPDHLVHGLTAHDYFSEPLIVIAPPDSTGEKDQELLESLPYIEFSTNSWVGQQIHRHMMKRNIHIHLGMEIDNLEAVAKMVANGLGVSVVPQCCCDPPLPLSLKRVAFGRPPQSRAMVLMERASNPKARLVRVLLNELRQLAQIRGPQTPGAETSAVD